MPVADDLSPSRSPAPRLGELEKLIARSARDHEAPDAAYAPPAPQARRDWPPPAVHRRDDSPSGGYDLREHDRYKHRRKKSWLEGLGDIFD